MRLHRFISAWLLSAAAMGVAGPCLAQLLEVTKQQLTIVNQRAPDFTGTDGDGGQIRLTDFAGKMVVLEWGNADCHYVRKWYASGAQPYAKQAIDAVAAGRSPSNQMTHAYGCKIRISP